MEQRNLLIAIVLSVGILIGFQFVFQRLHPTVPHVGTEATSPTNPVTTPKPQAGAPGTNAPGAVATKATQTVAEAIAGQPRVMIATPTAAWLDRPERGPVRRSDACGLSRNGRPKEPGGLAAVAARHRKPLSRRVWLGCG